MTEISKILEEVEVGRKVNKGWYMLARLDGRGFSKFTANLKKPFDLGLTNLMIQTTAHLMRQFDVTVGYTQSDEITLCWFYPEDSLRTFPFSGRYQKICSLAAATASIYFCNHLSLYLPQKEFETAMFDCRVWACPESFQMLDAFLARERDAKKNAISMAASTMISHKQLQGVHSYDRIELMKQKGVNFEEYPREFKFGSYITRTFQERVMTADELLNIPEKYRDPALVIKKTAFVIPSWTSLTAETVSQLLNPEYDEKHFYKQL